MPECCWHISCCEAVTISYTSHSLNLSCYLYSKDKLPANGKLCPSVNFGGNCLVIRLLQLDAGWVSSASKHLDVFQKAFAFWTFFGNYDKRANMIAHLKSSKAKTHECYSPSPQTHKISPSNASSEGVYNPKCKLLKKLCLLSSPGNVAAFPKS